MGKLFIKAPTEVGKGMTVVQAKRMGFQALGEGKGPVGVVSAVDDDDDDEMRRTRRTRSRSPRSKRRLDVGSTSWPHPSINTVPRSFVGAMVGYASHLSPANVLSRRLRLVLRHPIILPHLATTVAQKAGRRKH